jgi:nicotinamide-nucleotide amidase
MAYLMSAAKELVELCKSKGLVLATAESCTGGLVSAALTDIPGSSAIFDRGFVTYTNAAKQDLLGVTSDSLARFGAVSEEVAHEMALGALQRSKAGLAVSITGIAGPGGSEFKPEGRVCFGLADGDAVVTSTKEFGALGRANVRAAAVTEALRLMTDAALSM